MAKKVALKNSGILNKDVLRFKQGFEALGNVDACADFSYRIIKNLRIVQKEIGIFDDIIKPSKEYTEKYQPEIEKIAKEFCKKDPGGNPVPRQAPNGQIMYDFEPEQKEKFDKKIEALEKSSKFVSIVEARKKQIEKYTELMEQPCEVAFMKIPQKSLPETISPRLLEMIFELIED